MSNLTTKEVRLIRLKEVLSKTGLSKSTLYLLMSKGLFPSSCMIGARSVAWSSAQVDEWIASRVAKRDEVA